MHSTDSWILVSPIRVYNGTLESLGRQIKQQAFKLHVPWELTQSWTFAENGTSPVGRILYMHKQAFKLAYEFYIVNCGILTFQFVANLYHDCHWRSIYCNSDATCGIMVLLKDNDVRVCFKSNISDSNQFNLFNCFLYD